MNAYLALGAGIVCAGIGGELFVRGAVGLARWARIAPGIIGATVAAFATSSPEFAVSASAALAGRPQIGLGDALGSNVVNVALILGLVLSIGGMHGARDSTRRDFPVALLVPPLTGVLLLDGVLSQTDGLLMLTAFIAWLAATTVEARRQRDATGVVLGEHRPWRIVLSCGAGLAFLIAAGELIVDGARGIANAFGIGEFTIGATLVAIGTSAPELATAVVAKLRGHDEIGLGTVLGSNIFNGLLIVAVAAIIHPIQAGWNEVTVALAFGVAALALAFPDRGGFIARRRGAALLLLYVFYLAALFARQTP